MCPYGDISMCVSVHVAMWWCARVVCLRVAVCQCDSVAVFLLQRAELAPCPLSPGRPRRPQLGGQEVAPVEGGAGSPESRVCGVPCIGWE